VSSISKLRDFLLENRKDYLSTTRCVIQFTVGWSLLILLSLEYKCGIVIFWLYYVFRKLYTTCVRIIRMFNLVSHLKSTGNWSWVIAAVRRLLMAVSSSSSSWVGCCSVTWCDVILTVNCALCHGKCTLVYCTWMAVSVTKFRHLNCILLDDVCFSHIGGEQSRMTDRERDQIDADAEIYIKTCVSAIQQLRTQGNNSCVYRTYYSQLALWKPIF